MIHPRALVDDTAAVGPDTNVWAFAHVMAGARVGNYCNLGDHTFVESGAVVGNNVTLKNNVAVWQGVHIEDDVFVGPNVTFTNDRFPRSPRMAEAEARYSDTSRWLALTRIKRGCSIGAAATICPGIELGEYAMIAAGAVVTKNVGPYSLVVGSPARHSGYVCTCGQRLSGSFLQADCHSCGETAAARYARQGKRIAGARTSSAPLTT